MAFRFRRVRRRWLVALLWVAALAIYLASPLRSLLDREGLTSLVQPLGWWGPSAFVALYAVSMLLGLPTLQFTIAGGAVFGLLRGSVYSMLGATAGAMGAFGLSRYLLHPWAERRFGRHPALRRFQRGLARRGLVFVLAVRLVPVTPFNLENLLFGLTSVPWSHYLLGTVVGILPGTFAYSWLGSSGARALAGGSALAFYGAVALLLVLAALPWWLSRSDRFAEDP
jgi:uncharacterized membrane protein YdjX (TVP38/TMEM64 family)